MKDYFEFYNPVSLIAGQKCVQSHLAAELKLLGCKRVIVLSDNYCNDNGQLKIVRDNINAGGINIGGVYIDIPFNGNLVVVKRIADLCRINSCDSIVAVGGSSVLETAKCVKIVLTQNAHNLDELQGYDTVRSGYKMPMILLPVMCGSGSEVSNVSVIRDRIHNNKIEIVTSELFPNASLIDSQLIANLSKDRVLDSAFDALANAIESVCCLQHNPISTRYAYMAIMIIRDNLEKALKGGKNTINLQKLMEAASLAGVAQSSSMLGSVHSICHGISIILDVNHATAVGEVLPRVLKYNIESSKEMYGKMLFYILPESEYVSTPKEKRAEVFYTFLHDWYMQLKRGIKDMKTLAEHGLSVDNIDEITGKALMDGANLTNPRHIDDNAINLILTDILEGKL